MLVEVLQGTELENYTKLYTGVSAGAEESEILETIMVLSGH